MAPSATFTTTPASQEPRDTESWALTEAARRLIEAGRNPDRPDLLRTALTLNRELWMLFQASIGAADCPLPEALRNDLAALSLVVERETAARLADLDPTRLDTLIQVNRSLAAGLAQKQAVSPADREPRHRRPAAGPPAGGDGS